jgi:hypothetical protein
VSESGNAHSAIIPSQQRFDHSRRHRIPDTPVDYFPADDHGNHPAYFEVIGFDNEDVDKVIENLRTLRSKDRESLEKKEAAQAKAK